MLAHDSKSGCQTEARAFAHTFGGKEWFEDARQDFRWNAASGVLHGETDELTHSRFRVMKRAFRIDRPLTAAAVQPQAGGHAERYHQQDDRDESRDEVTHYNAGVLRSPALVAEAYAACDRLARSHYENFPVASRLLPRAMRPHIAAVYAFARVADDIADEGSASPEERQRRLGVWLDELHRAVEYDDDTRASNSDGLIVTALSHSIRSLDLPVSLFDDLVSAFRQDTMTTRYASWAEVLDYCRRSANPIGRLVLRIAGYCDEALDRSSDALCTALQLTNFWQDFGRDWRAGRLYVPGEVAGAAGAAEADVAGRLNREWTRAIEACVDFTRDRFHEGRMVCDRVHGRLRYELRLTWLGGRRILERVAQRPADLLQYRPTLGALDVPALAWRAARWHSAPA